MEQERGGILSFLKRCIKGEKEEWFIEYGSQLLQEILSISSSNVNYGIPIRYFSAIDICAATNGFHRDCLLTDRFYPDFYKCSLEGRLIFVKKFERKCSNYGVFRDIAVAAHMSIHRNVLKLKGWCSLEEKGAAVVYEYPTGGRCLSDLIDYKRHEPFPWKCRLRIAYDIANVITYLHTALHRPIVHMNITPKVFIVGHNGVVKLLDFSQSISIPLGESHVQVDGMSGTCGFFSPEYMLELIVTEKCDVYSFGILLLQLLTGQQFRGDKFPYELLNMVASARQNGQLNELLDPRILEEGGGVRLQHQQQQFLDVRELMLRCSQNKAVDRPDMIEVAKELRQIHKSTPTSPASSIN